MSPNQQTKWTQLNLWIATRPFWGCFLTLLSGLLFIYIPLQLYWYDLTRLRFVLLGGLTGMLMLTISILLCRFPRYSLRGGLLIQLVSLLALFIVVGGLLMGTLVGMIGGGVCITWHVRQQKAPDTKFSK
ncbi:hypothetical protein GCM10011391_10840 [Pullulanibacillus camelliae]|uniref:Uncharacterized protein n=1 Tax=Pullulanibacillus camelliae TaxID=1707096 RepID=A0A8J2VNH9_9BACL|nr:DUF6114 domain-containing protein [Pullulanibacillus camelliae]GGE33967.1 hypothetical protein GCM10011391_10840 [Pullulanibacillus camelliae]